MPKAFKFNLEPLLKYRRHLEEEKRRDLAEARRSVLDQNRVLLRLLQAEAASKREFAGLKRSGGVRVERFRLQEQHLNALARKIRREYETLQERLLREEEARRALVEARKKVRVLERLKDRRRASYDHELSRAERKELDEIGLEAFRAREGKIA